MSTIRSFAILGRNDRWRRIHTPHPVASTAATSNDHRQKPRLWLPDEREVQHPQSATTASVCARIGRMSDDPTKLATRSP